MGSVMAKGCDVVVKHMKPGESIYYIFTSFVSNLFFSLKELLRANVRQVEQ